MKMDRQAIEQLKSIPTDVFVKQDDCPVCCHT